jgi:hypothetical protein
MAQVSPASSYFGFLKSKTLRSNSFAVSISTDLLTHKLQTSSNSKANARIKTTYIPQTYKYTIPGAG